MTADDYHAALRSFHVDNPWDCMRSLGARLAFVVIDFAGLPINFKEELIALAVERNKCAHLVIVSRRSGYGLFRLECSSLQSRLIF
jgi:hypothetical protein